MFCLTRPTTTTATTQARTILTAVLHEQRVQFLAALDERLQRGTLDAQTEVKSETFEMDAVVRHELHMAIVDEADAVEVDDAQVRRVRLDLADVDDLVNLFRLLVGQLESTCSRRICDQSGFI